MDRTSSRKLNQGNDKNSKTVYDCAMNSGFETGNSHSPLITKYQIKKHNKNDFKNDESQHIKDHTFVTPQNGKSEIVTNLYNKLSVEENKIMFQRQHKLRGKVKNQYSNTWENKLIQKSDTFSFTSKISKSKMLHQRNVSESLNQTVSKTGGRINNLPTIQSQSPRRAFSNQSNSNSRSNLRQNGRNHIRVGAGMTHNNTRPVMSNESIPTMQMCNNSMISAYLKLQFQNEMNKLRQSGALRYLPKLSIDTPFMAKRIKFADWYHESDPRWTRRNKSEEDFQRNDQVKQTKEYKKNFRVVYDQSELSPYYDNQSDYIDKSKLIPIKGDSNTTSMNNRFRARAYGKSTLNSEMTEKKGKIYTSLNPYYVLEGEYDTTLIFESRFESGNLKRVIQIDDFEYDVIVRNDYNSQGYNAWWYFFSISNIIADVKYTFHIKDFSKPDSLYNQGMKPLIYSTKKADLEGIGWYRDGEEIWYYQNSIKKKKGSGFMFTLTFTIEFLFDNDEVYIAHCFPYTYRDWKEHIDLVCKDDWKNGKVNMRDKIRKTELWKSLAGNSLDLILISNFTSSEKNIAWREAVIIIGRVNSGESNSNFIIEGILEFLVSNIEAAVELRNKYVFKIIPMVNPDGVIIGNSIWSLNGQDLNRQYATPTKRASPEIYAIKQILK